MYYGLQLMGLSLLSDGNGIFYNHTYYFRVGTFYPDSDSPFDPLVDCSNFWLDKKIKINPMNYTSEKYMDNIQTSAYVAMGLNVGATGFCPQYYNQML